VEHERLNLRHWNRSASLPGDRKLEEAIQQELIRRFPPSNFPVNIDIVGGQGNTNAVVQINNFAAGIAETVKVTPEDFIASGGMLAAALAATENVISELQRAGRIPSPPPRQPKTHMNTPLSLHPIAHAGEGRDLSKWVEVIQFEVGGLPPGEQAWIANFGSRNHESWRVLRAQIGVQSDWTGDSSRADEALAVLQKEFQ